MVSVLGAGRHSAEVGIGGGLWYVGMFGSSGFWFDFIWDQLLGDWDFCDLGLDCPKLLLFHNCRRV